MKVESKEHNHRPAVDVGKAFRLRIMQIWLATIDIEEGIIV